MSILLCICVKNAQQSRRCKVRLGTKLEEQANSKQSQLKHPYLIIKAEEPNGKYQKCLTYDPLKRFRYITALKYIWYTHLCLQSYDKCTFFKSFILLFAWQILSIINVLPTLKNTFFMTQIPKNRRQYWSQQRSYAIVLTSIAYFI